MLFFFPANICYSTDKFQIFYCFSGFDYSTTAALTDKNLVTDDNGALWIETHRVKTGTASKIKLLEIPLSIIKKYELKRDANFILPVMSNAKYNLYLKEIASICGIEKNVTSHITRHSVLSFSLKNRELREETSRQVTI